MHQHPTPPPAVHKESASWTETLLHSRRTTLPKRLCGPGPDAAQQAQILRAAAADIDAEIAQLRAALAAAEGRAEAAEAEAAAQAVGGAAEPQHQGNRLPHLDLWRPQLSAPAAGSATAAGQCRRAPAS